MQAASRLPFQAIVRGSSSRSLLNAPLAPRPTPLWLPLIRQRSASSLAANIYKPLATADGDKAEVPVLEEHRRQAILHHAAKHWKGNKPLPPKHERHRSLWTDEENFEEVLKRSGEVPQASYDEEIFKNGLQVLIDRYKKMVNYRLALHDRADPSILEMCTVDQPGGSPDSIRLLDCCTAESDGHTIFLKVLDDRMIDPIGEALWRQKNRLGLLPQRFHPDADGIVKIEVPKPTLHSRLKLLRQIHMIIETGRDKMRKSRSTSHKQLKRDWFEKRIGREKWLKMQKRMFAEARAATDHLLNVDRPLKKEIEWLKDEIDKATRWRK